MATMVMPGQQMERMHARHTSQRRSSGVADRNRALYEQQRGRRRGATPEMFFSKAIDNSRIVKADDPERRREMRTFTVVMTLLFALTMVYVWQHFSAIMIGYDNETQKHYVEQLREQNRELRLAEAQLSDPGRIDRIAKQLGLDAPLPGQVVRPESNGSTAVVAEVQQHQTGTM